MSPSEDKYTASVPRPNWTIADEFSPFELEKAEMRGKGMRMALTNDNANKEINDNVLYLIISGVCDTFLRAIKIALQQKTHETSSRRALLVKNGLACRLYSKAYQI